jgi:hypothetical protein
MAKTITPHEVQTAVAELARMRRSLARWLAVRATNDRVLAGQHPVRRPLPYAQSVIAASRDPRIEQDLASRLHALLEVVMQGQPLPNPDVRENPAATVQLAQLAIGGGTVVASPTATGSLLSTPHPWLWPVVIVGGLLLVVVTAIKTAADVAKDREEKACIQAGACTDYGFWLKAGGVVAIAWVLWEKLGVKDALTQRRS